MPKTETKTIVIEYAYIKKWYVEKLFYLGKYCANLVFVYDRQDPNKHTIDSGIKKYTLIEKGSAILDSEILLIMSTKFEEFRADLKKEIAGYVAS